MTEKEKQEIIEENKRFSQFIRKAQREGVTSENVKLLEELMDDGTRALRDELDISNRALLRHLIYKSFHDPFMVSFVSHYEQM